MTKRQREAILHLANGNSIDQTADIMKISRSTVEKHLAAAKTKIGARNLINAIYIAAKIGLISILCSTFITPDIDVYRVSRTRVKRETLLKKTPVI